MAIWVRCLFALEDKELQQGHVLIALYRFLNIAKFCKMNRVDPEYVLALAFYDKFYKINIKENILIEMPYN